MWNNRKRLCLFFLVLSLLLTVPAALATESDLLITDPNESEGSTSDDRITHLGKVEVGNLRSIRHYSFSAYHPFSVNVYSPNYTVTLVEILVERNNTVKAGDPVAKIRGQADPIAMAQAKIDLLNAQNALAQGIASRESSIAQLQLRLAAETDAFEQEILSLTIQKQQLQLAQYRTQQEQTVTRLQTQLSQLESQNTLDTIYATADGRVTQVIRATKEMELSPGTNLLTISDPSVTLYRESLNSDTLVYGRAVTNYSAVSNTSYTGTIVGAPNILPSSSGMTVGYVKMDLSPEKNPTAMQLEMNSVELDNVLLVPYKAVQSDVSNSGYPDYYVMVLRDGEKVKCPVSALYRTGRENYLSEDSKYFILRGVNEGDILVAP